MNTIHVVRSPATKDAPEAWTARLGGPDGGASATALTPINALCALALALQSARHPFDPNWTPDDAAEPDQDAASGDAA